MTHSEISSEQRYFDRAYERLNEMVADSRHWVAQAAAARESAGPLRDTLVRTGLARATELSIDDEPLVFGRTDATDGVRLYIGRIGVHDERYETLVIDWRAPVAEAFYRATPGEPLGLVRRRHFVCRGPLIVRIDDELLDRSSGRGRDLVLVGEGALLDALGRGRTGRMRDIVATIQSEQDRVIRAPMDGVLVVQGGPGTGKTAVALHRAAYLLYTHREGLRRAGVLVVGPNPIFLRYIEQVLPSLGESATLATIEELVSGVEARTTEAADLAALKGDPRMADVIARAVSNLPRALTEPATVRYEGRPLVITMAASREIVRLARERFKGTHNERRTDVVGFVLQHLWSRWRAAEPEWVEVMGEEGRGHFEATVRRDGAFRRVLDALWPAVRAERLVADLLSSREAIETAAEEILTAGERELLHRPRASGWTPADVALIDEARVHLDPLEPARVRKPKVDEEERWMIERMLDDLGQVEPMIRAQRAMFADRYMADRLALEEDGEGTERPIRFRFGHVIVDEAQGLSPMQWRMVARRCPTGSITILGDLGQSSAAEPPASWMEVLRDVGGCDITVAELTINYRTPTEIMDVAARVLAGAAPGLQPPRSVRSGAKPVVLHVSAPQLVDEVVRAAREEAKRSPDGKVAVIGPPSIVEPIAAALDVNHVHHPDVLDDPVAVLSVDEARGLEFDSIIVGEPSRIVAECAGGFRALYVALTRATQRLVIVTSSELPSGLD